MALAMSMQGQARAAQTRINLFSRESRDKTKVGEVRICADPNESGYLSFNIDAPSAELNRYMRAFSRDLNTDAASVSKAVASSLRHASKTGIYDFNQPISSINIYMGDLSTWRKSAYGFKSSKVAAFVYRGSMHIRPAYADHWMVPFHEMGHVLQLHSRRSLGRNSYPSPAIREGGADLFFISISIGNQRYNKLSLSDVMRRYEVQRLATYTMVPLMHNPALSASEKLDLLSNTRFEEYKGEECHRAGARIAIASLLVNDFDLGKTVSDFFSVSSGTDLKLLLSKEFRGA